MKTSEKIILSLLILAGISLLTTQYLSRPDQEEPKAISKRKIDYYIEQFSILNTNPNGSLKSRLYADHAVHYPDDNTSWLRQPRLKLFQKTIPPLDIRADTGWVNLANKDSIMLQGNVKLRRQNEDKKLVLELMTSAARIQLDQQYAETEKAVRLIGKQFTIDAIGVKASFQEETMYFAQHERTTITPEKTN